MFFNSNKEINRLLKELNSLLSKGISNIYVKVIIGEKVTYSKLRLSEFNPLMPGGNKKVAHT